MNFKKAGKIAVTTLGLSLKATFGLAVAAGVGLTGMGLSEVKQQIEKTPSVGDIEVRRRNFGSGLEANSADYYLNIVQDSSARHNETITSSLYVAFADSDPLNPAMVCVSHLYSYTGTFKAPDLNSPIMQLRDKIIETYYGSEADSPIGLRTRMKNLRLTGVYADFHDAVADECSPDIPSRYPEEYAKIMNAYLEALPTLEEKRVVRIPAAP